MNQIPVQRALAVVHLLDSDPRSWEAIDAASRRVGFRLRCCEGLDDLWPALEAQGNGVAIVDFGLLTPNPASLFEGLVRHGVFAPVIALGERGNVQQAVTALSLGAEDYLEKPFDGQELQHCLARLLSVDSDYRERRQFAYRAAQRYETLTVSEREVIARVLRGVPNKQIAVELDLGLRTVELRRANVARKMHSKSLPHLVRMLVAAEELLQRRQLQLAGPSRAQGDGRSL